MICFARLRRKAFTRVDGAHARILLGVAAKCTGRAEKGKKPKRAIACCCSFFHFPVDPAVREMTDWTTVVISLVAQLGEQITRRTMYSTRHLIIMYAVRWRVEFPLEGEPQ